MSATPAFGQAIDGAGRFGLTTAPIRFESASANGGTATDLALSLGGPGLGLTLSAALSDSAVLGITTLLVHDQATVQVDDGFGGTLEDASSTGIQFLPHLAYVMPSGGSTRGYVGGTFGISHAASSVAGGGASSTATSLMVGPIIGAYVFLGANASVDLGAQFLYLAGIGDISGVSGFALATLLGVSAWWGGATDGEASNPREASVQSEDDYLVGSTYRRTEPPYATGVAERTFDRDRNLHVARARFTLGNAQLFFASTPQVEIATISVKLEVPAYAVGVEGCSDLTMLVNEEPIPASEVTVGGERAVEVVGRVDFQHLKVLGRPYATLGFEACGKQWKLVEAQRPALMKFLQLVSQIATDVQQGRLPPVIPVAPAPVPEAADTTDSSATPEVAPGATPPAKAP